MFETAAEIKKKKKKQQKNQSQGTSTFVFIGVIVMHCVQAFRSRTSSSRCCAHMLMMRRWIR